MAVPYETVNYDFGAADRLSWAAAVAHERVSNLIQLRGRLRNHLLGHSGSDNWSGANRHVYDTEFGPQQAALQALADQLKHLKSAVDDATRAAHAVNAHAH